MAGKLGGIGGSLPDDHAGAGGGGAGGGGAGGGAAGGSLRDCPLPSSAVTVARNASWPPMMSICGQCVHIHVSAVQKGAVWGAGFDVHETHLFLNLCVLIRLLARQPAQQLHLWPLLCWNMVCKLLDHGHERE